MCTVHSFNNVIFSRFLDLCPVEKDRKLRRVKHSEYVVGSRRELPQVSPNFGLGSPTPWASDKTWAKLELENWANRAQSKNYHKFIQLPTLFEINKQEDSFKMYIF